MPDPHTYTSADKMICAQSDQQILIFLWMLVGFNLPFVLFTQQRSDASPPASPFPAKPLGLVGYLGFLAELALFFNSVVQISIKSVDAF